ncbi:hypothetical protein J6590_083995, partial [Homalodisca vitripennis]
WKTPAIELLFGLRIQKKSHLEPGRAVGWIWKFRFFIGWKLKHSIGNMGASIVMMQFPASDGVWPLFRDID